MRKRLLPMIAALAASVAPALAANGMDCRCLYRGKYFEQGETVCIRVDGRARLARCEMSLNNSAWKFLTSTDGCPSAAVTPIPSAPSAAGSEG